MSASSAFRRSSAAALSAGQCGLPQGRGVAGIEEWSSPTVLVGHITSVPASTERRSPEASASRWKVASPKSICSNWARLM